MAVRRSGAASVAVSISARSDCRSTGCPSDVLLSLSISGFLINSSERYWLIENLLSPRVKLYRQAMYNYHRKSLDRIHEDLTTSKAIMLSSLKDIAQVNESYPNSMIIQMFSNSKRAEILEIFKNSVKSEQREVFRIMSEMDPAQSDFLAELR